MFGLPLLCVGVYGLWPLCATCTAEPGIESNRLLDHVRVLSSDEFEGRAPGTAGETKTVEYIIRQFKELRLEPGNPNGTYVQEVPMVGITGEARGFYRSGGKLTEFKLPQDCVLWSRRFVPEITVTDSEMVFVGYGVIAPEYDWDDFKGVDLRGKTMVVLVGDPPVPDPSDASKLDERVFKGREMTYYGRWTYKFEMAAQHGAAAALIVHETGPAGYPFVVVINSNTGELFELQAPDQNRGVAAVEGWITMDQAKTMLATAGHDYDSLKRAAVRRDFKPVALGIQAGFTVHNKLREVVSQNVVAKLPGSDARFRDEYVTYSAHWDHLGCDPKLSGDKVYHGARDNALGVAGLIELAREFAALKPRPKRSLLFMATTGEEQGLLGAKYYAEHPLYPIARTLANLNMDALNPWGRTRDVSVFGFGNSTLEDLLEIAADRQGRKVSADPEPEKGGFFRADHFEFAKVGVPALYFASGVDYVGKPAGYGLQKRDEFTANDYHKPSDVIKSDWDLSGAVEDLELLFEVGRAVANAEEWPQWKERSEFRAMRTAVLDPKR
ncbi:MAG: M20/M25/M40 family metallo-hydrolase [Verrucomicrobia bacterium]|nr:M20/M25/M40 family metallo-hydrolase [Verrucomicrobiota bacterium]